MARRKVKNGEKSPWGQCLTRLVANGPRRSDFWLVPENFCVFLPNYKPAGLWVVSCILTRNDAWMAVARHVSLGRSPRLWSRWKVPISAQNLRDFLRTLRENLTGEYAGPFAGVVTVAYLKDSCFLKHSPIHWCIIWFLLDGIYINVLSRLLALLVVIETLPIAGINFFVARARQKKLAFNLSLFKGSIVLSL